MKNEEKYLEHLKEAEVLTKKSIQEKGISPEFARIVFDKLVTPYHYFLQETPEEPTEKQIKYAENLGIENPVKYSKQELSKKIDEARTHGKKD